MPIICRLPGRENLKVLASAIGEPAAPKDKKERLAEIIDNAQKDIASLCNEKGCNIPAHPTFPDIISGLNKVTHFLQSAQISGLSAQVGFSEPGKMVLSWKNPISDQNYSGVMIRYKAGSYPVSQTDGTLIYDSNGTLPASETVTVTGLSDGTSYYVRGFACAISGASRIYTTSTTGAQCTAIPRQLKGQRIFTASSIFTVPYGVTSVDVFLVGGGGGGMFFANEKNRAGGGGGGYTKTHNCLTVTPGQSISVNVGAGGVFTAIINDSKGNGNTSSFGSITVSGGRGGSNTGNGQALGGNGGSGGGGDGYAVEFDPDRASGGSDGSNGIGGPRLNGGVTYGIGQDTTTRAFGESFNTLYAGGGGGGYGYLNRSDALASHGGAGGGGNGSVIANNIRVMGSNGIPNTGGGGGGSASETVWERYAGNGGSGIVIVRWGY